MNLDVHYTYIYIGERLEVPRARRNLEPLSDRYKHINGGDVNVHCIASSEDVVTLEMLLR